MRAGVIGGGLAGLVAAYDLVNAGASVTLFESTSTLGGQIRTRRDAGFIIEDGAEGWVAADQDVPDLCRSLGIGSEVVHQLERRSFSLYQGELSEMASGDAARVLGIQTKESDLGQGIASLRGGMATLTDALAHAIRPRSTWQLGRSITAVVPAAGQWTVLAVDGESWQFDAIVLAAPAAASAAIVQKLSRDEARALRSLETASNVSVSLGYERVSVRHPLNASGFVVDSREDLEGLRACAFVSSKLPARTIDGRVLLRAFFRPNSATISHTDSVWAERAIRLLSPVLGITGKSLGTWIARWPHALPQYSANHRATIENLVKDVQQQGRIEFAGTSFLPSGIPGAVRSGRLAARGLIAAG